MRLATLSIRGLACAAAQLENGSWRDVAKASGTATDLQTLIEGGDAAMSFLRSLVAQADLRRDLRRRGPYTLFVPTNDAFAALPEGTVDQLQLADNRETLQ